jgi:hypothetical protein
VSGLKICVIGGGSTYTPELIEGIIKRKDKLPVATIALMDIDENRLRVVGGLAERMLRATEADVELRLTTQRKEALKGADYVITQIRVGGLARRIQMRRSPFNLGWWARRPQAQAALPRHCAPFLYSWTLPATWPRWLQRPTLIEAGSDHFVACGRYAERE